MSAARPLLLPRVQRERWSHDLRNDLSRVDGGDHPSCCIDRARAGRPRATRRHATRGAQLRARAPAGRARRARAHRRGEGGRRGAARAVVPPLGATAQFFGATANNTTGQYLTSPYVDIPRIGGTQPSTRVTRRFSRTAHVRRDRRGARDLRLRSHRRAVRGGGRARRRRAARVGHDERSTSTSTSRRPSSPCSPRGAS